MTVPVWQPGTFYATGDLVRPATQPQPEQVQVENGTFEDGDADWTKGTGWTINSGDEPFQGSWSAKFDFTGSSNLTSTTEYPVVVGQSITLTGMVNQGASSSGEAGARVSLVWLDTSGMEVSVSQGTLIDSASNGQWKQSTITAVAPSGAVSVVPRAEAFRNSGTDDLWVDLIQWNYVDFAGSTALIFQAVQPTVGISGATEPVWPDTLGVQVIDNEVIWEAIGDTRIVWEATPILLSGATEPNWPTSPGFVVADNTINWQCTVGNITDPNCPNTKVVLIAASKVFAVDEDIVPYCATVNPLDWTTPNDAGYLPTGLQQYGANPMAALGLYRGNVVAWNSQGCQVWQVDEDPANMALLDALPVGSTYPKAVAPVANDLFFLTRLGVRSFGITAGSSNLKAGDLGEPIDPLIETILTDNTTIPRGFYFPSQGQYLLAFTSPLQTEWVPIEQSEVAYGFTGNDDGTATMADSVVTVAGFPSSVTNWTLDFAGDQTVRVTVVSWVFGVTDAAFTWDIGVGAQEIQPNEAGTPLTAFLPAQTEMNVSSFAPPAGPLVTFTSNDVGDVGNFSATFLIEVPQVITQDETEVFVYTMNRLGQTGSWTRYVFPGTLNAVTQLGDDLYLRFGDYVTRLDTTYSQDDVTDGDYPPGFESQPFTSVIWWPYVDMGAPGVTKQMVGFDLVGWGSTASVEIGYDQRNFTIRTDAYAVPVDTMPGAIIPMPMSAPTFSLRVTYDSYEGPFEWLSANFYFQDFRVTS